MFSSSRFQLCVLTVTGTVTDSFGTCDIKWCLSFNSEYGGKEREAEIKLICHGSRYDAKPDFCFLEDMPTNSTRFVKYYLWDLRSALKASPSDCFHRGERKWKQKISLCNSKAFNVTERSTRLGVEERTFPKNVYWNSHHQKRTARSAHVGVRRGLMRTK